MSTATVASGRGAEAVDAAALRDFPHRYDVVPIAAVYCDRFQRELSETWLRARIENFNPALFGVLILSERRPTPKSPKEFSVVDGQHRSELALRVGVEQVPGLVYFGLSVEQEAELFTLLQRERRPISQLERFNADLVACKPEALAVQRIVAAAGYRLENSSSPGAIKTVSALERIYRKSPELLAQILGLIFDTWGKMPGAANEHMIGALRIFLEKNPEMIRERFVLQLEQMTPSLIAQKGSQLRDSLGHTGSLMSFMAEIIENQYGSQRRRRV